MIFSGKVENQYRQRLYGRCDDNGSVFYYAAEDFPGLIREPYEFVSSLAYRLRGAFYHYADPIPGRLVVFDHGMGGGHRSYMKEIERLCRHGFLVFAYDHTGCMTSEGAGCNGFTQSLADLDDCLRALKADGHTEGRSIAVMGHSWGGYSCMNVPAFHPDVTHVVVLSGFVSVAKMLEQNLTGPMRLYRKHLYEVDKKVNPRYVDCDGVQALAASDAQILLIYSDNDPLVHTDIHYRALRNGLADKPNVTLRLVTGKGHNPNYTADAVRYKDEFLAALKARSKNALMQTQGQRENFKANFDWERMTAQDDAVWEEILAHLDRPGPERNAK